MSIHRNAKYPSRGALLLLLLLPGCRALGLPKTGVSFFTEPPGARILVDKKDTGFVTPCRLTLTARDDHQVEFELPGYSTARVALAPRMRYDTVLWQDMALSFEVWKFPLWLNFEDTITPVKVRANLAPGRVFVRLRRSAPR